jgi:hypothetical protein
MFQIPLAWWLAEPKVWARAAFYLAICIAEWCSP